MRRPHAVASHTLALGQPDRIRVEQAIRDGFLTVPLTISVQPGRDEEVEQALTRLGATVESRDPRIGYLRAEMPVDRVEDAYLISGVSRVDVDEPLGNKLPEP